MHVSVRQRFMAGLVSSSFSQIVAVAGSVLLVPFFLKNWNAQTYGQWISVTTLVSYLSILDLGTQSYIGNILSVSYAQGKTEQFKEFLSLGLSTSIALCFLAFLLVFALVLSPVSIALGSTAHTEFDGEDRLTLLVLTLNLLVTVPAGVYATSYRATGLYARGALLGNFINLLGLLISILCLQFGRITPLGYSVLLLSQTLVRTTLVMIDIRCHIPLARTIQLSLANAVRGMRYMKSASLFSLMSLGGVLNQAGVLSVLAITQPAASVAMFATHRTVAGLLKFPATTLQAPLWPELSFLWAAGNTGSVNRILERSTVFLLFFTGLAGIGLVLIFPLIYPLWTRDQLTINVLLFSILVFQAVFAGGWSTLSLGLQAANEHRELAVFSLLNGLVTLLVCSIASKPFGLIGVALATLGVDIFYGFVIVPYINYRRLHMPLVQQYGSMGRALILLSPAILAGYVATTIANPYVAVVLFIVVASLYGLFVTDRQYGPYNPFQIAHHLLGTLHGLKTSL